MEILHIENTFSVIIHKIFTNVEKSSARNSRRSSRGFGFALVNLRITNWVPSSPIPHKYSNTSCVDTCESIGRSTSPCGYMTNADKCRQQQVSRCVKTTRANKVVVQVCGTNVCGDRPRLSVLSGNCNDQWLESQAGTQNIRHVNNWPRNLTQDPSQCPRQVSSTCVSDLDNEEVFNIKFMKSSGGARRWTSKENYLAPK